MYYVKDIHKTFGSNHVLKGVSLDIEAHKTTVLIGPSGSGKTTLAEAMLYCSGGIRKLGRVDHGDAFLDTDPLERSRGITIFSKQALLRTENCEFTLLDTPGHVDFAAETERAVRARLRCACHKRNRRRSEPHRHYMAYAEVLRYTRVHFCQQNGYFAAGALFPARRAQEEAGRRLHRFLRQGEPFGAFGGMR